MVARWFRDLADKRVRRGSFVRVRKLVAAIRLHVTTHNQNPRVFAWTGSAETILLG